MRIILKCILKKQVGGYVDLVDLTQSRDKWWAFVNTIMNLRVLQNAGHHLTR